MTILKRDRVVPGTIVEVIHDDQKAISEAFILNAYAMLTDAKSQRRLISGDVLRILTKPRKRDGINLVKVESVDAGFNGEVFYTDLVHRCKEKV